MCVRLNLYFSVAKTQRSFTAATDAEVTCRNDNSSYYVCIPMYEKCVWTAD